MNPPTDCRHAALARGKSAETQAKDFLLGKGMTLLDAGWACRLGEIDLVMLDQDILVFIEVRARSESLDAAIESVDAHKQRRFVRAARAWLSRHPEQATRAARFDVVAISGDKLLWLRDAMSVHAG